MNKRLRDWLVFIGLLFMWTSILGYMQDQDLKAAEETSYNLGYQNGATEAVDLAKETLKSDQAELALQWWVGSHDMAAVRLRLCANNFSDKKVKK